MNQLFNNDDRDLKERFAALHRDDASHAPDFAATLRKTPGGGRTIWLRPVLAAALFVVVGLAALRFYSRPHVESTAPITEWKSPTDFLLQTPGHELLESVPQIGEWKPGEWPDEPALPGASPTPSRKKTS